MKIFLMILFAVIILAILYVPIIVDLSAKKKFKQKICSLNKQAESYLSDKNFTITKDISFEFQKNYIQHMLIDSNNRKICFFDYNKCSFSIFEFNNIIGYQVIKNNKVVLDDHTEYDVSLLYSDNEFSTCNELKLVIKTSSLNCSRVTYNIVSSTKILGLINAAAIGEGSNIYKKCVNFIEDFISFYETMTYFK